MIDFAENVLYNTHSFLSQEISKKRKTPFKTVKSAKSIETALETKNMDC